MYVIGVVCIALALRGGGERGEGRESAGRKKSILRNTFTTLGFSHS